MGTEVQAKSSPIPVPAMSPAPANLLQRKCACGGDSGVSGECEDCRKKQLGVVKRMASNRDSLSGVPVIVHDVLQSPGQPLEMQSRAFFEPRFGSDFSQVRVHNDGKAAESAEAVNALAYAVGHHIVFGTNQYAPGTQAGRRLIAHELAHTIQDRGGYALHPQLEVGRPDDPSERAADLTADAVLTGEHVSLAPVAGGVIRRQCVASAADRPEQRTVRCPDGSEYRVTLTTTDEPERPETRTTVNAGWNNTNIWLNIGVCRGDTDVTITPTVDLPNAVGQVLGNILVGSGALSGVSITPGLQITIVQSHGFTLTLQPSVTLNQSGVGGVGLGATVETPDITVGGSATYDPQTQTGMFIISLSPGQPQREVDCRSLPRRRLVFTCESITHVAEVPELPRLTETDREARYVFFDYSTSNLRRNFRLPTDIQSLHDAGYKITSIQGFTSPEGTREASRHFEGNEALSQERADAARRWIEEVCPICDLTGVTPTGRSELPTALGTATPEPTGPGMERSAVDEFLEGNPAALTLPDPLAPHDQAEREQFRRLPRSQQRNRAFELMRRAEITLEKVRVTQEHRPGVPAHDVASPTGCPQEVIEAARASFGINVVTGLPVTH
jgi:hypothetical protein